MDEMDEMDDEIPNTHIYIHMISRIQSLSPAVMFSVPSLVTGCRCFFITQAVQ
jgi:hypothetical protein